MTMPEGATNKRPPWQRPKNAGTMRRKEGVLPLCSSSFCSSNCTALRSDCSAMAKACFSGCAAQYQGLLRASKGCLLALKPLTHGFDAWQEHAKPAEVPCSEEVQLPMLLASAPAPQTAPAGDVPQASQVEKTPAEAEKTSQSPCAEQCEEMEREVSAQTVEVDIQSSLDHPNIVKLYEDAKRFYLVMELCTGGELFERIVAESEKHDGARAFDERGAATYMQQILGAMSYLHKNNFVHRDIKPENFLMQNNQDNAEIKVTSLRLAKHYIPGTGASMKTRAGTPYYVAPQVLAGAYDEKCDIWSCGVICYILLCGYPPFYGEKDKEILARVKKGEVKFDPADWSDVSSDAIDFIKLMLTYDPNTRPSAGDLLTHKWLTASASAPVGRVAKDLGHKLKRFQSNSRTCVSGGLERFLSRFPEIPDKPRPRMKKVALTLIAQQLKDDDLKEHWEHWETTDMGMAKADLPDDIVEIDGSGNIDYTEFMAATLTKKQYLRREVMWAAFRVFDTNGDGVITKDELAKILKEEDNMAIVEKMVADVDLDSNGEISFDEFCTMMESRKPTDVKDVKAPVATAMAAAASPCGTPANLAGRGMGFVCCSNGPKRQDEACVADASLHLGQVAEAVLQGAWHISSFLGRQLQHAAEAAKPHVVSLATGAVEKLRSSMERKSQSQILPKPTSSTWEANSRAAESRADSRADSRARPAVTPLDLSDYDVCSESGFTSCRTTCPPSRAIDRTMPTMPGLGSSFQGTGYDPSRDAQLRYSLNDGMPPQVLFQTQVPQSPFPVPFAAPRAAQSFTVQSLPGAQSFNTVFPQAQSFPALQQIQSFDLMAPGSSTAVYHHLPQAKILRTTLGEKRPFTGTRGPLISRPAEPSAPSESAESTPAE
eukprot:s900_g4.t1